MAPPSPSFRDEFQLRENHFSLPERAAELEPKRKRAVTICNLFVNHHLSISSIARLLDEDWGRVVNALIESSIVYDRRRTPGRPPQGIERRITKRTPS